MSEYVIKVWRDKKGEFRAAFCFGEETLWSTPEGYANKQSLLNAVDSLRRNLVDASVSDNTVAPFVPASYSRWTSINVEPKADGTYLIGGYTNRPVQGAFEFTIGYRVTLLGQDPNRATPWQVLKGKEYIPIEYYQGIGPHPKFAEKVRNNG